MCAGSGTDDLRQLGWSDAVFTGFEWVNDWRDLRLYLRHATEPIHAVTAMWASELRVDLHWHAPDAEVGQGVRRGGALLTWEASIMPMQDGGWSVRLDFAGDGELSFRCSELSAGERQID